MEKKRTKKALIALMCACLLVAGSVSATMAWLTDNDADNTAINTFTMGEVVISLDEAQVDKYGTPVSPAARVAANDYTLIPGHSYTKDPTVTVGEDSEPSYVRMLVTVNDYNNLISIFDGKEYSPGVPYVVTVGSDKVLLLQYLVNGWDPAIWEAKTPVVDTANDEVVYEFWYTKTVSTAGASAKQIEPLFMGFTLPGFLTSAQVKLLDDLQIDVVAHAIQADGMTDAADAWSKF